MRRLLFPLMLLTPSLLTGGHDTPRPRVDFSPPAAEALPPPPPPAGPRRLQDGGQAQLAALLDARSLLAKGQAGPLDFAFVRWVWVAPWWAPDLADDEVAKLTNLGAAYVSRAEVAYQAGWQPAGRLLRVDLRRLSPDDATTLEYLRLWEEFRFDPTFNRLITRDTINLLVRERQEALKDLGIVEIGDDGRFLVHCPPYRGRDGQRYSQRWVDVINFPSPHLDLATVAHLEKLTGSEAPVVEASYFLHRALSAIKDDGIYKTIWGGLYYDLAGIKTAKQAGRKGTDEDEFFRQAGLGDVDKKLSAREIFARVRSDDRAATFQASVNKKPRLVDLLPALSVHPKRGVSLLSVTHDIRDRDRDIARHAMLNMEEFPDAAREAFYPNPFSLLRFALFKAEDGSRQDRAPPDVVRDYKIPAPYTDELQPAIGCIRCHGVDGANGWQPVRNDFLVLRKDFLDVFADLDPSNLRRPINDVLNRQAGRYGGSFEPAFLRARSDYNTALLAVTGPWREGRDQTEIGRLVAKGYEKLWVRRLYTSVTAQQALREIGWDVPAETAAATLRVLVPPSVVDANGVFVPEDLRIGGLLNGLDIGRHDWDLVKSFVAARAKQNAGRLAGLETPAGTR